MKEIKVGQTWRRTKTHSTSCQVGQLATILAVDDRVKYSTDCNPGTYRCIDDFRRNFEFVPEPADKEITQEPKVGETWVKTVTSNNVDEGTEVVVEELYDEDGVPKLRHTGWTGIGGTTIKYFLENYEKVTDVAETSENPDKIKELEEVITELRYERDDFRQQVTELSQELQGKCEKIKQWEERFEKLELTNNTLRAELRDMTQPKTPWYKKWKII